MNPLYYICKEEYNLTKFLQYNLCYICQYRDVNELRSFITKYYSDETENTYKGKNTFDNYLLQNIQSQKENPDLYVLVCDFEDTNSFYGKSERMNMFNTLMFVMFDYYNLGEAKNMLRRYLETN